MHIISKTSGCGMSYQRHETTCTLQAKNEKKKEEKNEVKDI